MIRLLRKNPLVSTKPGDIVWSFELSGPNKASYLFDRMQQLPIRVDDDKEREDEAEDEEADDVGDVVGRLGHPVHRAGGSGPLGGVATPTEERRQGPDERIDPGQHHSQRYLPVVRDVGLGWTHHGAVAFIGKYGQGDE